MRNVSTCTIPIYLGVQDLRSVTNKCFLRKENYEWMNDSSRSTASKAIAEKRPEKIMALTRSQDSSLRSLLLQLTRKDKLFIYFSIFRWVFHSGEKTDPKFINSCYH